MPKDLTDEQRNVLRALKRASRRRDALELELRRLVLEARELGCTFAAIGQSLGRSHVQAMKTYRAGETGSRH